MSQSSKFCNDYGDNPECLRDVDERYTMNYSDVGGGSIYWCKHCGPVARAMEEAILKAFATRPGFKETFAAVLDKAHEKELQNSN